MKYFFVLTCLIICACHSSQQSNTDKDSTATKPTGFEIKQLAGIFYDTLFCTDCPGIATKIYLKPDNSYVMEQDYIGKDIVYDLGKWSVTDSILKLTGSEGPRQFKIMNYTAIKLLDNESRLQFAATNDTIHNSHSTLNRTNTPFKPQHPVPVEGIFSAAGDSMNLFICAIGNSYPVALAPAAMGIKATYNTATHQKKEPLYAKLEGHFELRPSLKDTTTQDFFVVERFIKFIPKQQCK